MIKSAKAPNTQKTYQQIDKLLVDFQQRYHIIAFPADPSTTSLFMTFLAEKYAPSTLRTLSSALSYKYKMLNINDPTQSYIVKETIKGHLSKNSKISTRLPISLSILVKLVEACQKSLSTYESKLYIAMFTTAMFAMLRVGEMVHSDTGHTIKARNILFEGQAIVLKLDSFKHSKPGETRKITLYQHVTYGQVCPVYALKNYLLVRPQGANEDVFIKEAGTSVTRKEFSMTLRQMLKMCGLDEKKYKGHSFRKGGASYAAAIGLTDAQIRHLGRWKSDAYKCYIDLNS